MMYYVFVHQPFATMICRGLLPVFYLDLQAKSYPCKVYVCSLAEFNRASDYTVEWHQECNNQRLFGNLPDTNELPVNQVIGSVKVIGTTDDPNLFCIRDAREFVAPFEVPFDQMSKYEEIIERMRTKMYIPHVPHLIDDGSNLVIPFNDFASSLAMYDHEFRIELVGSFAKLVLDEDGMLKPFSRFTVWNGTRGDCFAIDEDTRILHELNRDETDLKRYMSMLAPKGYTFRSWLHLSCHHPLND